MGFASGIIEGMMLREQEQTRIKELKTELQPASLQGKDHCISCGWCCSIRTCIPTPDELVKIAEHLEMKPHDAIVKYFAIDCMTAGGTYYVKPVGENIKDLAGNFIPYHRTYNEGRCIFLTQENRCSINKVKPKEAFELECWSDTKPATPVEAWKNNALLERFSIDGSKLEDSLGTDDDDLDDW